MLKKTVKSNKFLNLLAIVVIFILGLQYGFGQKYVSIGTKKSSTTGYPIDRNYNYSRWEGIYLSNEISQSGYLTSIGFRLDNPRFGLDILKNVKIYVKQTSLNKLTNGTFDTTGYTPVFEGSININSNSEYVEFNLTTPYYYDNDSNNLMITVEHGYQYRTNNTISWSVSDTINILSRNNSDDDVLPDFLNCTEMRPDIRLGLGCMFIYPLQDKSICSGDSVQIGNAIATEGGRNLSYLWENSTGLNNQGIANPIASPDSTQKYYLTVTGSECEEQNSDTMTLYVSNGSQNIKMGDQNVISICSGNFFDSGGDKDDYSYNEDHSLTIYPCDSLHKVSVSFEYFDLGGNDSLKVFFGNSNKCSDSTVFSNGNNIEELISLHSSGALTFVFHSDEQSSGRGWSAIISCIARACEEITGIASIRSPLGDPSLSVGDTLHSGEAILELTGYYGSFKGWLKSYNDQDYFSFTDSINPHTFNNTTTYYKALVTHNNDNDTCYSNVVKYNTSNNYYVNDNSRNSDRWCSNVGLSTNNGLSADKPIDKPYSIVQQYVLRQQDTIFIDAGTYYSSIDINESDSGSINDTSKRIVFLGAGNNLSHLLPIDNCQLISINQTYGIEFNGLDIRNGSINTSQLFVICNCSNLSISDCSLINYRNGSIMFWAQENNSLLAIRNNYLKSSLNSNAIEIQGVFDNCNISNNVIIGGSSAGILFQQSGETLFRNITINHNYIDSTSVGIYLWGSSFEYNGNIENLQITDNYINISDSLEGSNALDIGFIGSDSSYTSMISNNHFRGGFNTIMAGDLRDIKIFNNFISNSFYGISLSGENLNVGIFSNSFYNYTNNINFYGLNSSSGIHVKNNILFNTSALSSDACLNISNSLIDDSLNMLTSCDYNLFYNPNGAMFAKFGNNTISTIESLKSYNHVVGATKGDENSIFGDPLYFNSQNGDLNVIEESPVIDHGIEIEGINYDIYNYPLSTPPSIGASAKSFHYPISPNGPYAELKRKLDGGYHLSLSPYLLIKYSEEYNPINSKLIFKIYDKDRIVVMSSDPSSDIYSNPTINYGDNYCSINLFGCKNCGFKSLLSNEFYILEVSNDKNEKWYLRFKFIYSFNSYSQFIMCICVANQEITSILLPKY